MNVVDYARTALRVVRKEGPPLHLVFFVTNVCDFACQHCFLIANGELNDRSRRALSLDEIEAVARSVPSLFALSLTGGEPFLRKDYPEVVALFARHTRMQTLSTVSNGVQTDRILPPLERVLAETKLDVFLTISLDGSAATHDIIRRKPGAFGRTLATIRELQALRERYPRFALGINSTYIGSNYADLMELYDVLEDIRPHFVTLNMMRGRDWTDLPLGLSADEYRRLNDRKNALMARVAGTRTLTQRLMRAKDAVMTELVAHTHERQASLFPCYGGRLFGVLKDNGDVFPCEQLTTPFGNVRDEGLDFMRVWRSGVAERERRFIVDRRCHCTYECVMSANVLFNPRFYPRLGGALLRG
jgi:MoaA/NifB/PqqE/SkfB family radical SAM enzyme